MHLRRFLSAVAGPLLCVVLPAFSQADELEAIAPLINEQTMAVVSVDLQRIDLASLQKQYLEPLMQSRSDRVEAAVAIEQLQEGISQLKTDGARNVYLVLTAAQMPQLSFQHLDESLATSVPFLAIPGAKAETLEHWRAKFWNNAKRESQPDHKPPLKAGQIHGIGVVAFAELFDTLAAQKPQPRPEVAAALAAAGDGPVRLAIVPPPYFARAAEEILLEPIPGMKQPLGQIVARGAKWVGFGIEPNLDRFSVQLVIQAANAQAATNLADVLNRAVVMAGSKLAEDGQFQNMMGMALLTTLVPTAEGDRLTLTLDRERSAVLHQFAAAALQASQAGAIRRTSQNNLKQIGLAMLNFHSAKKQFPDRAIRDKDGKPLLSWRVAVLPYLEGGELYKEFHLDEPWDSDHNRKLIEKMPGVFRSPDSWDAHPGRTRYLAVVGEEAAFPPKGPISLKDYKDGTSKTIQVVEADRDHAVIWTKPDDLEVDLDNPLKGLATKKQMFSAGFADGHVSTFSGDIDPKVLRAYFTRDGREAVQD